MAAWSYRVSYDAPPALDLAPEIGSDVKCPLPRPDYYIHQDRGIGTDADAYDLANDGPIARCIVESTKKVYVERNLYAHLLTDEKLTREEETGVETAEKQARSKRTKKPPFPRPQAAATQHKLQDEIGGEGTLDDMKAGTNSLAQEKEENEDKGKGKGKEEEGTGDGDSDAILGAKRQAATHALQPTYHGQGVCQPDAVQVKLPPTVQPYANFSMSLSGMDEMRAAVEALGGQLEPIDVEAAMRELEAQKEEEPKEPEPESKEQDEDLFADFVQRKPSAFVVLGKPGIGTTTIAKKIAEYLKCVYVDPEAVIRFYGAQQDDFPEHYEKNPPDSVLLGLLQSRLQEQDVVNRGYVLEGIPRFNEDTDTDYSNQAAVLASLDPKPEYIIIPHMQDVDLCKRRSEQKIDVQRGRKYTRSQYTNKKIEPLEAQEATMHFKKKRKQSLYATTDDEYAGLTLMAYAQSRQDFLASNKVKANEKCFPLDDDEVTIESIPSEVIIRLVTSEDDTPYKIQKSFERYGEWLPHLQSFIDKCDVRKVLELNAYWAPPIIMKMVLEFIDNHGLTPAAAKFAADEDHALEQPTGSAAQEVRGEDDQEESPDEEIGGEENPSDNRSVEAESITGEGADEENRGEGAGPVPCTDKEKDKIVERIKLAKKPLEYLKILNERLRRPLFGAFKDYCPVTLLQHDLIRKGSPRHAAEYRGRTYYCADVESLEEFSNDPSAYLPEDPTPNVPPPRICITGSPGCGQEEVGQQASHEHGIYYFNFRQRLHEIIRVKLGKDVGPDVFIGDFDRDTGSGILLGLKESSSDFDIPSSILLDEDKKSKASVIQVKEEDEQTKSEKITGAELRPSTYSVGARSTVHMLECPPREGVRRDWNQIPNFTSSIKAFLENGALLPDEVLVELLSPFWLEEPFKSKGFIMVGFPNSAKDVEFMLGHNLVPEFVYTLNCKPKTMRNRLLKQTVDNWHIQKASAMKMKTLKDEEPMTRTTTRSKMKPKALFNDNVVQRNVQQGISPSQSPKTANWTYKDSVSADVSDNLFQYHHLYTRGLKNMQISLNENRIDWEALHTDFSLQMSKAELKKSLTSKLLYRNSFFESTYVLQVYEALLLLEKGFFHLSKFGRWCPVQISKGNTAVNLWNAPGIKKVPVLHQGQIYYIAGEENVAHFRENVWNLVTQNKPTPAMPLFVVVTGPPKSGKSFLAQKLAYNLGLIYIAEETLMDEIVKHSFLNKITEDYDLSSSKLSAGPQPMLMADEILAYLRAGYAVPPYMVCRVLDLALMAPRAQFHGAVFDNYPLETNQLQELIQRGIVPSVVVNLQMKLSETIKRCERHRFDSAIDYETLLEEDNSLIEQLYEENRVRTTPLLDWFRNETQCVLDIDANTHPTAIYEKVTEHCFEIMAKHQKYIQYHQIGKPITLDGLTPLTSILHAKFTREFGAYDPVAINDLFELSRVDDYDKDLKRVVEYRDEIYVFSSQQHVDKFLKNPQKYTVPTCEYVPPEVVPMAFVLTPDEMKQLEKYWGFRDFDPVFYTEGDYQYEWLQRGDPQFCAEYNGKTYFFMNQENLNKFLRKPYLYTDVPFPRKFPSHAHLAENPLDSVSPAGYIIGTGLSQELCCMLTLLAEKRPRFPFMSPEKSASLYLGYYLKTLNMKGPSELRTHYRQAMAHMTNTQVAAERLSSELNKVHGKRAMPAETKEKLQLLLKLAEKDDAQKLVDPHIPGLPFSYKSATTASAKSAHDHGANLPHLLRDTLDAKEEEELKGEDKPEEAETDSKASKTSHAHDSVPPAYLAKDKLW